MTIIPLTAYSLRGFDPSERFAFVWFASKKAVHGIVVDTPDGEVAVFSQEWELDGTYPGFFRGGDLLEPLPDHPLPDCLKHLRPEPVQEDAWIKAYAAWFDDVYLSRQVPEWQRHQLGFQAGFKASLAPISKGN